MGKMTLSMVFLVVVATGLVGCDEKLNKNSGFEYHFKNLHQINVLGRWTILIGKEYGFNEVEPNVKEFIVHTGTGDR